MRGKLAVPIKGRKKKDIVTRYQESGKKREPKAMPTSNEKKEKTFRFP